MKVRDIYITCEKGLEAVTPLAVQGVSEMMACFPKYEKMYPVSNLKNWQSDGALVICDGQTFLEPYEAIQKFHFAVPVLIVSMGNGTASTPG